MKLAISLLLLTQLISIYWSPVLTTSATFGSRQTHDGLLKTFRPNMHLTYMRKVRHDEYFETDYISWFEHRTYRTITYIEAIDNLKTEGTAKIQDGGVGAAHVKMYVESDYGTHLNFTVNIYGCIIYVNCSGNTPYIYDNCIEGCGQY